MPSIEQRIRYVRGLAAKDIVHVYGIEANHLSLQFMVGTDADGVILWAPETLIELIGKDVMDVLDSYKAEATEIAQTTDLDGR